MGWRYQNHEERREYPFHCLATFLVLFKVSFFLFFQNLMGWSSMWHRVSLMLPKFEFDLYHVTGFSLQVTIIWLFSFLFHAGYFCPAVVKAVKTIKKGEKILLNVSLWSVEVKRRVLGSCCLSLTYNIF